MRIAPPDLPKGEELEDRKVDFEKSNNLKY